MKTPLLRWPAITAKSADEPLAPLWIRLLWMAGIWLLSVGMMVVVSLVIRAWIVAVWLAVDTVIVAPGQIVPPVSR